MWRKAITTEDASLILDINRQNDQYVYDLTNIKGAIDYRITDLVNNKFNDKSKQYWIYEEKENKAVIVMFKNNNGIGHIENFCAIGFNVDLYSRWKIAFPILVDKVREIADTWGLTHYYAISPRTRNGECQAYFAQIYLWEATVTLSEDQQSWLITVKREQEKIPVDESQYKVINPNPTVDADVVPPDEIKEPLKPIVDEKGSEDVLAK